MTGVFGYVGIATIENIIGGAKMISEVDHIAITVSDMEKNLAVYRDLLGMEVLIDTEITGPEIGTLLGITGARIRTIILKKGESTKGMVELLEVSPAGNPSHEEARPQDVGPFLLSFEVEDVEKKYQEFLSRGVQFISPPRSLEAGLLWTAKAVILHAPDGVLVELVQYQV